MSSEQIIYICFRAINTGILFAVFVQTFRRFGYPWLKEQVLVQLRQLSDLKEKILATKKSNEACAQATLARKHEASLLLHKVKIWRLHVEKERERDAYECAMRAQVMQTVRKEQEEQFEINRTQRELGARVLAQAHSMLVEQYATDKKLGEKVVQHLCKEIEGGLND